jgi:hypothetical protein
MAAPCIRSLRHHRHPARLDFLLHRAAVQAFHHPPPAGDRAALGQGGDEKAAVVVIMGNCLTPVTTRHHEVKNGGKFTAQAARQDR